MKTDHFKGHDLCLGDIVKLSENPYSYATVKYIDNDKITFYRPYVHTDDIVYTGGVICYIGLEEFSVPKTDQIYEVVQLGGPLK